MTHRWRGVTRYREKSTMILTMLGHNTVIPARFAYPSRWRVDLCAFLSHLAIDASSYMKVYMNHCVNWVNIDRMCRSTYLFDTLVIAKYTDTLIKFTFIHSIAGDALEGIRER